MWLLLLTLAAGPQVRTVRHTGTGGDIACVTRLAVELDRAHRRGERVTEAECRTA